MEYTSPWVDNPHPVDAGNQENEYISCMPRIGGTGSTNYDNLVNIGISAIAKLASLHPPFLDIRGITNIITKVKLTQLGSCPIQKNDHCKHPYRKPYLSQYGNSNPNYQLQYTDRIT